MSDISRWIDRHAERAPDKPAIRFADAEITYADLATRIEQCAQALAGELALEAGDRIAYLGHNRPEMLTLLFACARAGLVLVPLNWRLAAPEHRDMLADSGARVLVACPDFAEAAADALPESGDCRLVATDIPFGGGASLADLMQAAGHGGDFGGGPEHPLLIVYTSGTTGRPKGAILTQGAIAANALSSIDMHGMTEDDRILTVLPMFHVGGLNIQTTPALHQGATVILHRRFDASATLASIGAGEPTLTLQVPATMQALLAHPQWERTDLSCLRAVATGSTDVPVQLIEGFHARGVPVIQVYGSTETGPVAVYQRIADAFSTVGSIGRVGRDTEIRLVDEQGNDVSAGAPGEILVRGGQLASGYWNDPETTASTFAEGWFRSGDVALADAQGWLWFKDRIKNVIISGGENIYPAELERVLRDVPGIAEAAVVGRPDVKWGTVPVAVVVPARDAELDRKGVLQSFEGRLARYKHPRDVVFVDALPRNAMGKVKLEEVRTLANRTKAVAI